MIHVDTGFIIHALVPVSRADRRLRQFLREGEEVAVSSIAWTEFLCGPVGTNEIEYVRSVFREISPFTDADCETAGDLFNRGGRRRRSLADCMIAAVALRGGASLATTNPKDFQRFGVALTLLVP